MTSTSLVGKTIGKYQIIESLGRGGMAQVYRAYQENLERYVAIKVMHAFLAEEEDFRMRFQREAKAMASLNHSHIVSVYDSDVQDDLYYIVMEYVGGGSLKERITELAEDGEQMPLNEAVRLVLEIADALGYAHARGMVHRDIKPANIMLDDEGHAVLTDFGIAKILSGPTFTATGAMIGTPAYMSPEQGLGKPGDERSDLYALGVLFFQMVTGHLPYDADTPLALILQHVNKPTPQPEMADANLPQSVQAVINKAMAKDPDDRYQKAGGMIRDLKAASRSPEFVAAAGLATGLTTGLSASAEATVVSAAMPTTKDPASTVVSSVAEPEAATAAALEATEVAAPPAIEATEIAAPLSQEMSGVTPPVAAAAAAEIAGTSEVPTPVPEAAGNKGKLLVIGGAIIAVLLVAAVAAGFLISGLGGGSSTATPDDIDVIAARATETESPDESPKPSRAIGADTQATDEVELAASATSRPSDTPRPSPTPQATVTTAPTASPTADATATLLATCVTEIELVNSYTFQNANSNSAPVGTSFPFNWVLRNTGACPIPGNFVWSYHEGVEFGQSGPISVESELLPGEDATLTMNLYAPDSPGTYESSWQLLDDNGEPMGEPSRFEIVIYQPATPTPEATVTPTATATSEVVAELSYNWSVQNCEYIDADWRCMLVVTPSGGVGPYTLWVFDSDQPGEYRGEGSFTHWFQSRRCSPWIHEIKLQDDETGSSVTDNLFVSPEDQFEGGCTLP